MSTCQTCFKAHRSCVDPNPLARFNFCEACVKKGVFCTRSEVELFFQATDFVFKHAPGEYGWDESDEYQPAPANHDIEADRNSGCYKRQYFYVETAEECSNAWSPLFVRREIENILSLGRPWSIFGLTPVIRQGQYPHECKIPDWIQEMMQTFWAEQREKTPRNNAVRSTIKPDVHVLTCRRICTLYGYLDLGCPRVGTFPLMSLQPGMYKVRWHLQFFDPKPGSNDSGMIDSKQQEAQDSHGFWRDRVVNLFGFPRWPGADAISYPGRPTLRLSVGYGRNPARVRDYPIDYRTGHNHIADQVLSPQGPMSPRVDTWIGSRVYFDNLDNGWIAIEDKENFRVVEGQSPVFVVSSIDNGSWQGGFRFGGVELTRVQSI